MRVERNGSGASIGLAIISGNWRAKEDRMDQAIETKIEPLRLSRVFHAPRATVFKAWSSAEHIKRWFAPETFTVPEATVRMEVGGPFDLCMPPPAGEAHWIRGTFVEITIDAR